ncbi:MAG: ATP-binding protein [Nitrospirota bacterium]|nr:ATP-binding protein [Nitrospirota bacterium]
MAFRIFPRLLIGSFILLMVTIPVGFYAVWQMERFSDTLRHILAVESELVAAEKRLTDALLAQMRYERKYVLLKDRELHRQFLAANDEFGRVLEQAVPIADTPQKGRAIKRMEGLGREYRQYVEEESVWLADNRPYAVEEYRKKKDEATDGIATELKKMKILVEGETAASILELENRTSGAWRMTLVIAVAALTAGGIFSYIAARWITTPLSLLIDKTERIARGDLRADLSISSPPEVERLAASVNLMCEKLREVDQMKSDFFSAMSHELRTPLASIREGISLLSDGAGGQVTEKQRRLLAIISEESDRLISLVNTLLDLAKMEAGMMPLHCAKADMLPLVQRVIKEMEPLAVGKGVTLGFESESSLALVNMDNERVLQVIRNLLGNAVKFTAAGSEVMITTEMSEGELVVSVKDAGPGLLEDERSVIFEKFRQGISANSVAIKGTGLGLAIVKQVVSAHGGKVWVESRPGEGSTFSFSLPA